MPIDMSGYVLSNSAGLKLGASESRILAADYGIKDPMLPGMLACATSGGTYKHYPFAANDCNLNIGSPWSVSTYRFTAPVAGIYYTSYSGIVGNGAGANGYYGLIINGGLWYFSYRISNALWEIHHIEQCVKLAAGDWVSWAMNIAPAPDSGSDGGAYRSNHNTVTIWLVG